MDILLAVVGYLILVGILVICHELGHYAVARFHGVHADRFSIGFGRPLLVRTDRRGTQWTLSPWLLGGFVSFPKGQSRQSILEEAPYHARMNIVAAGPLVNIVLAYLILWSVFSLSGVQMGRPIIDFVSPDTAAERIGLEPGDMITHIDGHGIRYIPEAHMLVMARPGEVTEIRWIRDGTTRQAVVRLGERIVTDNRSHVSKAGLLGVSFRLEPLRKPDLIEAADYAIRTGTAMISANLRMLKQMVVGQRSVAELSGPVRIADSAGQALKRSIQEFMILLAIASLSIAIVNLLPIPGLDGFHLLRFTVEQIRGRAVPDTILSRLSASGMAIILLAMVLIVYNDIRSYVSYESRYHAMLARSE